MMLNPFVEHDLRNGRQLIRVELLPLGRVRLKRQCTGEEQRSWMITDCGGSQIGSIIDDYARAAIEGFDKSSFQEVA